jgi:putative regulator of septum formation
VPKAWQWQAGARFFSCGLFELASQFGGTHTRSGSVRDGLRGQRPLAIRCGDQVGTKDNHGFYATTTDILPLDCAQPHTAEFAGVYSAPDGPLPADSAMDTARLKGCEPIVAAYLGLSVARFRNRAEIGMLGWGFLRNQWTVGQRWERCYVTVSANQPVHGSLKGLGGRPLPT